MRFFRNPEIRRQLLWFLLCGAALTLIAYWIDPVAGATAAVCWAVWMVLHFVVTHYRYKRIAQLSRTIDALLHGEQNVRLSGYVEGELAILQSELEKLTVRLRQNADNLVRDKQYLADSLADISHQIRTPLTAMRLTVSLLGEPELSEERRMDAGGGGKYFEKLHGAYAARRRNLAAMEREHRVYRAYGFGYRTGDRQS